MLDGEAAAILEACAVLKQALDQGARGRRVIESWCDRFDELTERVIELQPKTAEVLDELNLALDALLFEFNARRPNHLC